MISGIISAPNSYSPMRHPERAKKRRDITLKRMRTLKWISEDVYNTEVTNTLKLNITPIRRRANWYVDALVEKAENQVGEGKIAGDSLQVYSSLDPVLQQILESTVADEMKKLVDLYPKTNGAQVAAVVLSAKTGDVLALVGVRAREPRHACRAARVAFAGGPPSARPRLTRSLRMHA